MRGRRRSYFQEQIGTKVRIGVGFRRSSFQRKTERALAERERYSQDAKGSDKLSTSRTSLQAGQRRQTEGNWYCLTAAISDLPAGIFGTRFMMLRGESQND